MPQAKIYVRNIRGNPINVHTVRLEENQIILAPRNQEIRNLMTQKYLRGLRLVEIQQLKKGDYCLSPRLEGIKASEIQKLQKGDYVESPKLA